MKRHSRRMFLGRFIRRSRKMRVVIAQVPPEYKDRYPFVTGEPMLYLGEIQNMPGHVAVVNQEGKVFWGYHPENFRKPREDEI